MRIARNANTRHGLQRRDDAQLGKARNIRRINELNVFDAVTRVARPILAPCQFIGIQCRAHAAVTNGMGGDLQLVGIGPRDNSFEFFRRVERCALVAGMAGVVVQHLRRQRLQNAVDEELHPA